MSSHLKSTALCLGLTILASCGPQTKTKTNDSSELAAASDGQEQDWTNAMTLLKGYDVISGLTRGDCATAGFIDPGAAGANGNVGTWKIDFISNASELQKSLDVSASASLSAASGAGGSAKAKYSNNLTINSYSVYAVASVQIERAAINYRDVLLKDTYVRYLEGVLPEKMKTFRTRCGDKFVIGQRTGGEYQTLIEIKAASAQEREAISAKVKGSAGVYSASGSFSSALNSLSKDYSLRFSVFKVGGSNDEVPTDPLKIIERATAFEKEVDERSVPYKAILADYETLENFPFEDPIRTGAAVEVLDQLNAQRLIVNTKRADISYVLLNTSQFNDVDGEALSAKLNDLNDADNKILAAARNCSKDIDTCAFPTNLPDISVKMPKWRDSVKAPQVMGPHPSCGVLKYKSARGSVCGVEQQTYKSGTGAVCGVAATTYNRGRDAVCGVEAYNVKADPICGVTEVRGSIMNPAVSSCVYGGGTSAAVDKGVCPYEGLGCLGWEEVICKLPLTCANSAFGVAAYKECEHPQFGTASVTYNTCKNPDFGVDTTTYNQCEHETFGVDTYKSCMHDI